MYVLVLILHKTVYGKRGYKEVVGKVTEDSMQAAVEEAKAQSDYITTGEVFCIRRVLRYQHIHTSFCLVGHYRCTT